MSETALVTELRGRELVGKWRLTLRQARKTVARASGPAGAVQVRARALGPIRRPVFVLGCPRSGTTYLGEVLESLPGVTYFYEPPILKSYARLVYDGMVTPKTARRFYRRTLRTLLFTAPGSGPRVVEKNPNHTWVAEALLDAFPDASFVTIGRDGRDTALSLSQKPWHRRDGLETGLREPGGYPYGPYPHFYIEPERRTEFIAASDLHRCIWVWRRHAEEIARLHRVLPAEVQHHVRYEDLVTRPTDTVAQLLAFLGEDDAESRRRASAASEAGHAASVGRWRQEFSAADIDLFEREAGETLGAAGYV